MHPALAFAQLVISALFIVAGEAIQGKAEPGGLIPNTYLFAVSAGGAGLGGLLYIFFNALTFKTTETSAVRVMKFMGCLITGGVFTPWYIHKFALDEAIENVLGVSTLAGLLGWSVVATLLPWAATFIPRLIKSLIGARTGLDPDK